MPQPDKLAVLLSRCAGGEQNALQELYDAVSSRLFGVCLALVKRQDLAEDILQDSFLRIWMRAGSFDARRGTAMTWMSSIVRNRALDLLRSTAYKAQEAAIGSDDMDPVWEGADPSDTAHDSAATAAVLECLEGLASQQRRSILMAYFYGYSHSELSAKLETPLGTIKAWIRRGMEKLRECLG